MNVINFKYSGIKQGANLNLIVIDSFKIKQNKEVISQ